MKKIFLLILCAAMLTSVLFGCAPNSEQASATTVSPVTTQETTAAPITFISTNDNAVNKWDYDMYAVKQQSEKIQSQFNKLISDENFNGAAYVKLGNDFEYLSTTGMADTHISNSINTCYFTGSITKQLTAAAVMMLAEQKKLDLDDTVDKYISSFENGKKITVRQLLDMTSGVKNYIVRDGSEPGLQPELEAALKKNGSESENRNVILNWIKKQKLSFEPGESFVFSDSNYYLLGEVISKVAKTSYSEYIYENILKPLGMNSSGIEKKDGVAAGIHYDSEADISSYKGAGYSSLGLVSSLSDLMKWVDGFTEGTIVSKEGLDKMFTPNSYGYGLGFYCDGESAISNGSFGCCEALLNFSKDKSKIFIALSNDNYCDPSYIRSLFRNYLSKYLSA